MSWNVKKQLKDLIFQKFYGFRTCVTVVNLSSDSCWAVNSEQNNGEESMGGGNVI